MFLILELNTNIRYNSVLEEITILLTSEELTISAQYSLSQILHLLIITIIVL